MSDLGGTLHSISSHLDAFARNGLTPSAAEILHQDNAQLQHAQNSSQKLLDAQTLALATQIMNQLNALKMFDQTQKVRPSVGAQSQASSTLQEEKDKLKKKLEEILKMRHPSQDKPVVEPNFESNTQK